jgi:hypothetical protein
MIEVYVKIAARPFLFLIFIIDTEPHQLHNFTPDWVPHEFS